MRYLETVKVLDPQELQRINGKDLPSPTISNRIYEDEKITESKIKTVLLDNRFSYLRERMASRKKHHRLNKFAHRLRNVLHM